MQYPSIDPVIVHIGPLALRWYGLMYIIGFIASFFIVKRGAKQQGLQLTGEQVADYIFTLAIGVILGARLGYILVYNFSYYLNHPLKLFAIWEGGMSFHGGLIGGLIAACWFFKKHKLNFWQMSDLTVLAIPVGLGFGRIGNFINGELYGRVTTSPFGMVFPGGGPLPRHPSQLYESFLEGLVLFIILQIIARFRPPRGVLFWTFITGYGLFRFIVEFFREPDQQLGFLWGGATMGQLLSLPMFVIGLVMVIVFYKKGHNKI